MLRRVGLLHHIFGIPYFFLHFLHPRLIAWLLLLLFLPLQPLCSRLRGQIENAHQQPDINIHLVITRGAISIVSGSLRVTCLLNIVYERQYAMQAYQQLGRQYDHNPLWVPNQGILKDAALRCYTSSAHTQTPEGDTRRKRSRESKGILTLSS